MSLFDCAPRRWVVRKHGSVIRVGRHLHSNRRAEILLRLGVKRGSFCFQSILDTLKRSSESLLSKEHTTYLLLRLTAGSLHFIHLPQISMQKQDGVPLRAMQTQKPPREIPLRQLMFDILSTGSHLESLLEAHSSTVAKDSPRRES